MLTCACDGFRCALPILRLLGKPAARIMAGHSRSKNGVISLAYVPAIHVFLLHVGKVVDARHKAGHDEESK
jgi:hypothetical protein